MNTNGELGQPHQEQNWEALLVDCLDDSSAITENADETVADHRCCFRFVLVRPCTGSEQHGHDSAIARRHLAAWNGSGHTGRRDRNSNGGRHPLIARG